MSKVYSSSQPLLLLLAILISSSPSFLLILVKLLLASIGWHCFKSNRFNWGWLASSMRHERRSCCRGLCNQHASTWLMRLLLALAPRAIRAPWTIGGLTESCDTHCTANARPAANQRY